MGMKRYFVADCSHENGSLTVVGRIEISKAQFQEMHRWFDFSGYYHTCRSIVRMTQESGQDFINFCEHMGIECGGHDDLQIDNLLITGNKLLISYLSFVKTFIDVISKAISDKSREKLADFQKFNRLMYDEFFGYRLLTRMRNYVVHYDMPLTKVTDSVKNGIVFACDKDSLLRYNGWSSVKDEIAALPEQFSIMPTVAECQAAIEALFLKALEVVVDDVLTGNEAFTAFCKQYDIRFPVVLILDDETNDPPELTKFPLHMVREYAKDLSRHPNYKINVISDEENHNADS